MISEEELVQVTIEQELHFFIEFSSEFDFELRRYLDLTCSVTAVNLEHTRNIPGTITGTI